MKEKKPKDEKLETLKADRKVAKEALIDAFEEIRDCKSDLFANNKLFNEEAKYAVDRLASCKTWFIEAHNALHDYQMELFADAN